jgi:cytidylate kinase
MPILAVTREMGSLGTYIGQEVARRLGYAFVRHEIIAEAAQLYDAVEQNLIATVEAKPGVWESLSEAARRHFAFIAAEVFEFALKDNVVIVGRWSTLLLRGVSHALRVRVCAPMDLRVHRTMERLGLGAEEARARVLQSDRGIRARMRQFFEVEWGEPLLYDLTLSTDQFTIESGADLLCHLLGRPEWQPTEASRAALTDLTLAARVRAVLKAAPETTRLNLTIRCRGGKIELAGTVSSAAGRSAAVRVAAAQPGVVSVEDRLVLTEMPVH